MSASQPKKPRTQGVRWRAGESLLYADDGESFAYERGELMLIKALWNDGTRELTLSLARGSKVWEGYRDIDVEICPGSGSQRRDIRRNAADSEDPMKNEPASKSVSRREFSAP